MKDQLNLKINPGIDRGFLLGDLCWAIAFRGTRDNIQNPIDIVLGRGLKWG